MKNVAKIFFLLPMVFLSFTTPPKKLRVVFFGDSITQAGVQPTGYITKLDSIVKQAHLPDSVELIGAGIGLVSGLIPAVCGFAAPINPAIFASGRISSISASQTGSAMT